MHALVGACFHGDIGQGHLLSALCITRGAALQQTLQLQLGKTTTPYCSAFGGVLQLKTHTIDSLWPQMSLSTAQTASCSQQEAEPAKERHHETAWCVLCCCRVSLVIGCFHLVVKKLPNLQELHLIAHKQCMPCNTLLLVSAVTSMEVFVLDINSRPVRAESDGIMFFK